MPVENEIKYVLREPQGVLATFKSGVLIWQGYLDAAARIRKKSQDGQSKFYFTYKEPIGSRVIEIETEISQEDFDALWPLAQNKLKKTRYVYRDDIVKGETWDIDVLFDDDGNTYFAMAECEMDDPDQSMPSDIPAILEQFVWYVVPRDQGANYSNRRLSDPNYAQAIIDRLSASV